MEAAADGLYRDYEDLLVEKRPDGVVVATLTIYRVKLDSYDQALKALPGLVQKDALHQNE